MRSVVFTFCCHSLSEAESVSRWQLDADLKGFVLYMKVCDCRGRGVGGVNCVMEGNFVLQLLCYGQVSHGVELEVSLRVTES